MNISQEIEQAFSDLTKPDGKIFIEKEQDEGEEKYFRDRTWRNHSIKDLRYHAVAMILFTPEAHRYFLPAFMLGSLRDPESADVIPDHILYHFADYKTEFWSQRVSILTAKQKGAVSRYLLHFHKYDRAHKSYLESALEGLSGSS